MLPYLELEDGNVDNDFSSIFDHIDEIEFVVSPLPAEGGVDENIRNDEIVEENRYGKLLSR